MMHYLLPLLVNLPVFALVILASYLRQKARIVMAGLVFGLGAVLETAGLAWRGFSLAQTGLSLVAFVFFVVVVDFAVQHMLTRR